MSQKNNFIMYTCYHEDFNLDANILFSQLALNEEEAWDKLCLFYDLTFPWLNGLPEITPTDLDDPRENRSLKERLYDIGWRVREAEILVSNFDVAEGAK